MIISLPSPWMRCGACLIGVLLVSTLGPVANGQSNDIPPALPPNPDIAVGAPVNDGGVLPEEQFPLTAPSPDYAPPPDEESQPLNQPGVRSNTTRSDSIGWHSLFNGRDLTGWKKSEENPGTFRVVDGQIVARGPRSHLFYVGPVNGMNFKNFALKCEVLTTPGANSGVYFHTQYQAFDWLRQGIEAQICNSGHDTRKTGSLHRINDILHQSPARDNQWFTLHIVVIDRRIVVLIDDRVVINHVEPENPQRDPGLEGHILSSGTFALQGNSPTSEVRFRKVLVRSLPSADEPTAVEHPPTLPRIDQEQAETGGDTSAVSNSPAASNRVDVPGRLGVNFHELVRGELEAYGVNESGAVVTGVYPHLAAAAAGIQPGDLIVEVAGEATPTSGRVATEINKRFAGDEVPIVISRRGARQRITVRLSPPPKNVNAEMFKEADAGQRWAQFEIAKLYHAGKGTKQDFKKARLWYEKAADGGVATARYNLALMHERGEGGEIDLAQARRYYEQVAEQGYELAQYKVALMHYFARGGPFDHQAAARWYKQAASAGHTQSQYELARMVLGGQGGLTKDVQAAIGLFTKASEDGHTQAMAELGYLYIKGEQVPADYDAAARWLTPAAESGIALAQHELGALYFYGRGVERNVGKAAKWFELAGNQGIAESQVLLGILYQLSNPPDLAKSLYWRERAAAAGNAHGMYALGNLYHTGLGVPQDKRKAMDYYVKAGNAGYWPAGVSIAALIMEGEAFPRDDATALLWLKPAAERAPDKFDTNDSSRIAKAQVLMGAIYYHGANNVARNLDNAFYWFEKAARGGDLEGQRNYGQMLRDRNRHAEAVTWLREAATKGDRAAQNDLGMMYLNGLGVAQSEEEAIAWLLRAYQQGSPTAKDTLSKLGVNTN